MRRISGIRYVVEKGILSFSKDERRGAVRTRVILRVVLSGGIGLIAWVGTFWLLWQVFVPVQRWYFHKYVESFDPDPPFLPLDWVVFQVFPLVATVVGGAIAGFASRTRSYTFDFMLGLTFATGILIVGSRLRDWQLLLYSALVAATGFVSSFLGQWFAKRSSAS